MVGVIKRISHSAGGQMKNIAHYAILQLRPYANRSEHVNYGLVVFLPTGGIKVYIATRLRKVRAMSPSVSLDSIREQEELLPELIGAALPEEALDILNAINVLDNQEMESLGRFTYMDQQDFNQQVDRALASQVEPPATRRKGSGNRPRLFFDVRSQFRDLGILAENGNSVPDHQVVEHYAPDPAADIKIEFALQNGLLRLAQTIDLRNDSNLQTKSIAYSKAYAIDYAGKVLEKSALETFAVVAGSNTEEAKRIMATLKRTTDHVLSWEDRQDMEGFFSGWAKASGKPLPEVR